MAVPERVLTNHDLEQIFDDADDEWIVLSNRDPGTSDRGQIGDNCFPRDPSRPEGITRHRREGQRN